MGLHNLLKTKDNSPDFNVNIKNLTYLLAADRILFPDINYSVNSQKINLTEVLVRNYEVTAVFPEFFKGFDITQIDKPSLCEVIKYLNEEKSELLHVPGRVHENSLSIGVASQRKKQGSYYTPLYIISYMANTGIKYLTQQSPGKSLYDIRIIDPACGGASFLIEFVNKLLDNNVPVETVIKSVHGIDRDYQAVEAAVFALTLAVKNKSPESGSLQLIKQMWQSQIKVGNALTKASGEFSDGIDWPQYYPSIFGPDCSEQGFDLVIGNPPYVSNKLIPAAEKKYYRDNYNTASGQYDLSVLFMEQGLDLLKNDGVLSYITSNKFMAADYGAKLRKILVNSYEICEIIDVSTLKSFKNTSVYPVIFSARKSPPNQKSVTSIYNISSWEEIFNAEPVLAGREVFTGNSSFIMTTRLNSSILPIIRKIEKAGRRLSANIIHCGIANSGFSRWVGKEGQIPASEIKNYYPFIQAGHIKAYSIKSHDFINIKCFDSPKWLSVKGPKLVIPGIAKKLTAALDMEDRLAGRVYFIRQGDTDYDLYYLTALFNSYVLDFYYGILYWSAHLEGNYLRFNSTYLANLPVVPSLPLASDKRFVTNSLKKVGAELVLKDLTPTQFCEKQCLANALAFELYGISADEAISVMDLLAVSMKTQDKVLSALKQIIKQKQIIKITED